jgi:serine acetyltransferase
VWLGAGVVVTSGVRIGRRSVIGANSVVTRDIPELSVAAGIPAKIVSFAGLPEPSQAASPDSGRAAIGREGDDEATTA